jgi:hypothetical protein
MANPNESLALQAKSVADIIGATRTINSVPLGQMLVLGESVACCGCVIESNSSGVGLRLSPYNSVGTDEHDTNNKPCYGTMKPAEFHNIHLFGPKVLPLKVKIQVSIVGRENVMWKEGLVKSMATSDAVHRLVMELGSSKAYAQNVNLASAKAVKQFIDRESQGTSRYLRLLKLALHYFDCLTRPAKRSGRTLVIPNYNTRCIDFDSIIEALGVDDTAAVFIKRSVDTTSAALLAASTGPYPFYDSAGREGESVYSRANIDAETSGEVVVVSEVRPLGTRLKGHEDELFDPAVIRDVMVEYANNTSCRMELEKAFADAAMMSPALLESVEVRCCSFNIKSDLLAHVYRVQLDLRKALIPGPSQMRNVILGSLAAYSNFEAAAFFVLAEDRKMSQGKVYHTKELWNAIKRRMLTSGKFTDGMMYIAVMAGVNLADDRPLLLPKPWVKKLYGVEAYKIMDLDELGVIDAAGFATQVATSINDCKLPGRGQMKANRCVVGVLHQGSNVKEEFVLQPAVEAWRPTIKRGRKIIRCSERDSDDGGTPKKPEKQTYWGSGKPRRDKPKENKSELKQAPSNLTPSKDSPGEDEGLAEQLLIEQLLVAEREAEKRGRQVAREKKLQEAKRKLAEEEREVAERAKEERIAAERERRLARANLVTMEFASLVRRCYDDRCSKEVAYARYAAGELLAARREKKEADEALARAIAEDAADKADEALAKATAEDETLAKAIEESETSVQATTSWAELEVQEVEDWEAFADRQDAIDRMQRRADMSTYKLGFSLFVTAAKSGEYDDKAYHKQICQEFAEQIGTTAMDMLDTTLTKVEAMEVRDRLPLMECIDVNSVVVSTSVAPALLKKYVETKAAGNWTRPITVCDWRILVKLTVGLFEYIKAKVRKNKPVSDEQRQVYRAMKGSGTKRITMIPKMCEGIGAAQRVWARYEIRRDRTRVSAGADRAVASDVEEAALACMRLGYDDWTGPGTGKEGWLVRTIRSNTQEARAVASFAEHYKMLLSGGTVTSSELKFWRENDVVRDMVYHKPRCNS